MQFTFNKPNEVIRGIDRALTFLPANAFAIERDQLKALRETAEQLAALGGDDMTRMGRSVKGFLRERFKTQFAAVEFYLTSADANASAYGGASRGVGDAESSGGDPPIPGNRFRRID